jgi:hypothetical protein
MTTECMSPQNWNLVWLLTDRASTVQFLKLAHADIRLLSQTPERERSVVYQFSDVVPSLPKEAPKRPGALTLAALRRTTPEGASDASVQHMAARICIDLEWAISPESPHLVSVWYLLAVLFVSPALRARVCEHTEKGLALFYFHDFEVRFAERLCGYVVTDEDSAKRRIIPAQIPPETVAEELIFVQELITSLSVPYMGHYGGHS